VLSGFASLGFLWFVFHAIAFGPTLSIPGRTAMFSSKVIGYKYNLSFAHV